MQKLLQISPKLLVINRKKLLLAGFCLVSLLAQGADPVGVTFLRSLDSSLIGSGVAVVQAEAPLTTSGTDWEVSPLAVGLPSSLFTWISSTATNAGIFTNSSGTESFHADEVGNNFYGTAAGVAPGVAHIDNYEAGLFYNSRVQSLTAISGKIVNQSFVFLGPTTTYDQDYDNYADHFKTLFICGAGNSGPPSAPATCYNGLAVAAYGGSSSTGPTTDGRSKPDITAPGSLTSFSTPLVSGAAAILLQAANRDDGGSSTAARAGDIRTLKALLLNGAEKPADWTHLAATPLDTRYGAGVLNVWNSYRQLRGGKQALVTSSNNGIGGAHLPPNITNNLPTRRGWDQNTISSGITSDTVNHYLVDLRGATNRTFTVKATLVWLRQQGQTTINDLDLFLYDAVSDTLVGSSQSAVDNVEHLFLTNLPPSRYDLQVLKNGGLTKRVTPSETYALAFEFGPPEDARIANPQIAANQFQGRVIGEPNQNYAIYKTAAFASWSPVVTNRTSGDGFFDFTDSGASTHRFYRTKLVP